MAGPAALILLLSKVIFSNLDLQYKFDGGAYKSAEKDAVTSHIKITLWTRSVDKDAVTSYTKITLWN